METAIPGDVVYCDPPYVPLSVTANFTGYATEGFGPLEQIALADAANRLAKRGVPVVISNHDTPWVREIYSGARLESFGVQRRISRDSATRGAAQELLAVFA
jgi:DNA adenine methylase